MPWEVISVMFTVVMVGAVVCGLVLAAAGDVREDVGALREDMRALQMRMGAVELRMAAVESGQARLEGLIEGLREALTTRPPANE